MNGYLFNAGAQAYCLLLYRQGYMETNEASCQLLSATSLISSPIKSFIIAQPHKGRAIKAVHPALLKIKY